MSRRIVIASVLVAGIAATTGVSLALPAGYDHQICVVLASDPSHHDTQDFCISYND